jgi:Nuclease A inhibitor-like protein
MQKDIEQLIASIDSSIQGLLFRTESDHRLKPFIWDISTQGEFDISGLLKFTGNLVAIELDDFLSWREYLEDFERWEKFLEQNPEYLTHEKTSCTSMPMHMRLDAVCERAKAYELVRSKLAVMEERSQSLLNVLQAYGTNLQVYRVVKYEETLPGNNYSNDRRSSKCVFESFKILVCRLRGHLRSIKAPILLPCD